MRVIRRKQSFVLGLECPLTAILLVDLVELGLLLIDLHLQFVDNVEQVILHHVVLEPIILVFELLLHALDVQLGLQEAALRAVVGDIFEELLVAVAQVEEGEVQGGNLFLVAQEHLV